MKNCRKKLALRWKQNFAKQGSSFYKKMLPHWFLCSSVVFFNMDFYKKPIAELLQALVHPGNKIIGRIAGPFSFYVALTPYGGKVYVNPIILQRQSQIYLGA